MKSGSPGLTELLLLCVCVCGELFLEPSESPWALLSVSEQDTRLPCRFNVSSSETQVVQVTWSREKPGGVKEQIITAHFSDGETENPLFSGRVRFESSEPVSDSAVIIMGTSSDDEGIYLCEVATFPMGNYEIQVSLTVWTKPITSLEPFVLVEGQSFSPAASCRSVARPSAALSWDTELPGRSQNRSAGDGVASIQFSLYPLRSMNGQKLDCLVWHPTHSAPLRIANTLVVHYPPDAVISGQEGDWTEGASEAALLCSAQGNPEPQRFNWTRKGGALPEGVVQDGGSLRFTRPLLKSDGGEYVCTATNLVGTTRAERFISVSEAIPPFDHIVMIIIGAVALLIFLILISIIIAMRRHYMHKDEYFKKKENQFNSQIAELESKVETSSRISSQGRLNSTSTEPRFTEARFQSSSPASPLLEQSALRHPNGSHPPAYTFSEEGAHESDSGDSETTSSQISHAMAKNFQTGNKTMRLKSSSNSIILPVAQYQEPLVSQRI